MSTLAGATPGFVKPKSTALKARFQFAQRVLIPRRTLVELDAMLAQHLAIILPEMASAMVRCWLFSIPTQK